MTSPSAITAAALDSTSRQGSEPTSTIILNAWPSRKSPTSTLASLPQRPARPLAAPHVAFVDDVVVQQRRGMHEFDGGGELDVAGAAIAAGPRSPRQDRPQPLAARGYQMVGDLGDHRYVGAGARQIVWLTRAMSAATSALSGSMRRFADFSSSGMTFSTRRFPCQSTRPDHREAANARQVAIRGPALLEILRTNDLVLISFIESLLTAADRAFRRRPAHGGVEGSLGFLPRRILVDAREEDGRAASLTGGPSRGIAR